MRNWIHRKALQVFLAVLGVYVLICCTVTYVGVLITYYAAPTLLASGLLAWWTRPRGTLAR